MLRYLNFWSHILITENGQVNFQENFQVSGKFQNLLRHILLDNSRGKGNQTMKSGQLIQYNTKNTFFEKSYTKCDEEASLRSIFFKLSISLDQQFEV